MSAQTSPMLLSVAIVALLWVMLGPNTARAFSLQWSAPPACADENVVRERIAQTLGARAEDPSIVVVAQVTTDGTEWVLEVSLSTPQPTGVRTLRAASCEPLLAGVAVVVAALWPPEVPQRPVLLRLEGSLAIEGEQGALPGPTVGVAPGLALYANRLRLGLTGTMFAPREASARGVDDAGARVGLWTVSLSTCFDVPLRKVALSPCAWFEAGQMFARETGLGARGSGAAPWLAPGSSIALRIKLTERWTLNPEILSFFPLRRARFDVGPRGDEVLVHEHGPVSLRVALSIAARLWDER